MQQPDEYKIRINYSKTQQARYLAHLDTIDIIIKALRRLQLPYSVTQGCHVRPKISFGPPLPLGHASLCEYFILSLTQALDIDSLIPLLNQQLPQGITVTSANFPWVTKKEPAAGEMVTYQLHFNNHDLALQAQQWLLNPETAFEIERKGKIKCYTIGKAVLEASLGTKTGQTILLARFIQGLPHLPSVSKIVTALAEHLGPGKDHLLLLQRMALKELKTGDRPI